jgi:hypothetical protein
MLEAGGVGGVGESGMRGMPLAIESIVTHDNFQFLFERAAFHPSYFNFVAMAVGSAAKTEREAQRRGRGGGGGEGGEEERGKERVSLVEWALTFLIETLSRAAENSAFASIADGISALLDAHESHLPSAALLLGLIDGTYRAGASGAIRDAIRDGSNPRQSKPSSANAGAVELLLLQCPDQVVRTAVARLMANAMRRVSEAAQAAQAAHQQNAEGGEGGEGGGEGCGRITAHLQFADHLLSLIDVSSRHWHRFNQFWSVIEAFAVLGREEAAWLNRRRTVGRLIDFFLGSDSSLNDGERKDVTAACGVAFDAPDAPDVEAEGAEEPAKGAAGDGPERAERGVSRDSPPTTVTRTKMGNQVREAMWGRCGGEGVRV